MAFTQIPQAMCTLLVEVVMVLMCKSQTNNFNFIKQRSQVN